MKKPVLFLLILTPLWVAAEEITFRAEMILAQADLTSIDQGQLLWEEHYRVLSGENVKFSYVQEGGETHTFVLELQVPEDAALGSQKLAIHGFWDKPDGMVNVVGAREQGLWVEGEMELTLFLDETTNKGVHLRITPRIDWSAEDQEARAPLPPFPLENAFVLFNDQVIFRDLEVRGQRFLLRDGEHPIALLSPVPFANDRDALRVKAVEGRFNIQTENWRLDIINGKPFEPATVMYLHVLDPSATRIEQPELIPTDIQ